MRVTLKSLRIASHLAVGLGLVVLNKLDARRFKREELSTWWHRVLLRIFEIEVSTHGTRHDGTRVIVCNHVSWLDISLMAASEPTRFVSKAEVGAWPLIGWLTDAAGTFYIRRGAGGTRQLIESLRERLGEGSVIFFPEGTTTDGTKLLKFQPRLFATAIETQRPVQPVALRFSPAANGMATAPFIGDDDLLSHIARLLRHGPIKAEVIYCAPIAPEGHDRDSIAEAAYEAICAVVAPEQLAEGRVITRREAQASEAEETAAPARAGWLRAMR